MTPTMEVKLNDFLDAFCTWKKSRTVLGWERFKLLAEIFTEAFPVYSDSVNLLLLKYDPGLKLA